MAMAALVESNNTVMLSLRVGYYSTYAGRGAGFFIAQIIVYAKVLSYADIIIRKIRIKG